VGEVGYGEDPMCYLAVALVSDRLTFKSLFPKGVCMYDEFAWVDENGTNHKVYKDRDVSYEDYIYQIEDNDGVWDFCADYENLAKKILELAEKAGEKSVLE
jgi:hypothetical protein